MFPNPSQKRRRRRGVILTPTGLQKLIEARTAVEFAENGGRRYTLEELSERTDLAVDTLTKVFACEAGVDKQTLKACFKSFKLMLEAGDFAFPEVPEEKGSLDPGLSLPLTEPEIPEGQVPLTSNFYVERPPIETDSYKAVLQPGALIRIKGSRRMGKTSLMARSLHYAGQEGCQTVSLSFQLADREVFQDLQRLLQWFCASVGLGLQLPNQLDQYWDELFGSQISCKMYFEQYLLPSIAQPLVLGLDDVDRLFYYPDLAGAFFSLLRTWHEEGKNRDIWKKLRMVVVHSTDVYIPLDANKSPFNVGLPIELQPLDADQIQALADQYELDWSSSQVHQLMDLVGGQPYLVRKALYHLWRQDVDLMELLQNSCHEKSIYSDHLHWQLWQLQQHPPLAAALKQVLQSPVQAELDPTQTAQLQSMGLIYSRNNQLILSCGLYQQFFSTQSL